MKLFGSGKKPSSKKHPSTPSVDVDRDDSHRLRSEPPSPQKSSPKSSPKKSSRPSSRIDTKSSSRPSRGSRHSTDPGSSSRRSKIDPDTHPLNLPPDERKRLSELSNSAMSDHNSMDIDQEPVDSAPSTPPQTSSAQTNFAVPIPNGTTHEDVPAPPPHRSNPSSPAPNPEEDAEAYKAAGNRFFKEKNYGKAIEQYSKGRSDSAPSRRSAGLILS